MKLGQLLYSFCILLWYLPYHSNAQTKKTEFQVFNAEGVHYKSYIKLATGDNTSYTSYHFKDKSIRNITIQTSKESTTLERIVYEYNYIEDTTQLKKSKNIQQLVERNKPSQLNFKNRENWSFYIRNDSLLRYDLEE